MKYKSKSIVAFDFFELLFDIIALFDYRFFFIFMKIE